MLPHLFEEEQVALPLQRAYFSPAEMSELIAKETNEALKTRNGRTNIGAFFHVLGSKSAAMQHCKESGIPVPWLFWHVPCVGFKATRALYRRRMVSHIDSLLAGRRVSSLHKQKRATHSNL